MKRWGYSTNDIKIVSSKVMDTVASLSEEERIRARELLILIGMREEEAKIARTELDKLRAKHERTIKDRYEVVFEVSSPGSWSVCGLYTSKQKAEEQIEQHKQWRKNFDIRPVFSDNINVARLDQELSYPECNDSDCDRS